MKAALKLKYLGFIFLYFRFEALKQLCIISFSVGVFILGLSFLFKFMHWAGAVPMLAAGTAALIIGILFYMLLKVKG